VNRGIQVAVAIPAVAFLGVGVAIWIVPVFGVAQLGMTLLEGVGRSSQIADLASFFMTMGGCMLIGLFTQNRVWFYPPLMLLGLAITGRVLAWAVHGAALAIDMIAVEVLVSGLLIFASSRSAA